MHHTCIIQYGLNATLAQSQCVYKTLFFEAEAVVDSHPLTGDG